MKVYIRITWFNWRFQIFSFVTPYNYLYLIQSIVMHTIMCIVTVYPRSCDKLLDHRWEICLLFWWSISIKSELLYINHALYYKWMYSEVYISLNVRYETKNSYLVQNNWVIAKMVVNYTCEMLKKKVTFFAIQHVCYTKFILKQSWAYYTIS